MVETRRIADTQRTVETPRTGSALTGRPLKDRVIEEAREVAEMVGSIPADATADHLEPDVSSSLETIRRVTQTYAILLEKLSAYELKVRELSQALGTATLAREEALKIAAEAEHELAAERRRCAQAEEQAALSAQSVHELESQLASLRAQTSKLMQAVDQLFPDVEAAAAATPRGLRVVR